MSFQIVGKILKSVGTGSNMKARTSQYVHGGSQSLCIDPTSYPSSGRVTAAVSGVECRGSPTQRGCTFRADEAGGDRERANLVLGSGLRVLGFGPRVAGYGAGFRVSGFGFWVLGYGCWLLGSGFRVSGSWVSGFGFRVLGFGSWISDIGFLISGPSFCVSRFE